MNRRKWVVMLGIMLGFTFAWGEEFKHPGWDCRDIEQLQAQLALATTDTQKISMGYLIAITNHAPADFAEACGMIDTAVLAVNPSASEIYRLEYKKQYLLKIHREWLSELVSWCQANPSGYDMHICFTQKNSEWAWQRVADCLLQYKYLPSQVLCGIDYLNKQSIALDKPAAEVAEVFKKLNRMYSALLVDDQAAWEKVVAQIRTLMETL